MNALAGTSGRRRIYLMRHGFVDYTSEEVVRSRDPRLARLTERGREEARQAGIALQDVNFDLAVCSGLKRTVETLEIVLSEHSELSEYDIEPDFEELHSGKYINFDSAQQLAAMMTFQFEKAGEEGATFLEGGELFSDAMKRVEAGVMRLLSRPDWANALIVAHEGINRMFLSWAIGAPLGASAGFEQDTACINIIDFDLVPRGTGEEVHIERAVIKAVNMTPPNYMKSGMNLRSFEAIFMSP